MKNWIINGVTYNIYVEKFEWESTHSLKKKSAF